MTVQKLIMFVRQEPVSTALLPLITALVGWLVYRGVVTAAAAPFILAVVAAFLGLPATAIVRSQVTPVVKVPEVARAQIGAVITAAANDLGEQLGPDSRKAVDALAAQARLYAGRHRGES